MSLTVDGVWKAGVWATTAWADGVWFEGTSPTPSTIPIGGAGHPVPKASIWWGEEHHKPFKKTVDWILDRVVSEYYGELTEPEIPKAVQKKAAAIVRPYAKDGNKIPEKVDWAKLEADAARVRKLLELWQEHFHELDLQAEEEEWMMLH